MQTIKKPVCESLAAILIKPDDLRIKNLMLAGPRTSTEFPG